METFPSHYSPARYINSVFPFVTRVSCQVTGQIQQRDRGRWITTPFISSAIVIGPLNGRGTYNALITRVRGIQQSWKADGARLVTRSRNPLPRHVLHELHRSARVFSAFFRIEKNRSLYVGGPTVVDCEGGRYGFTSLAGVK